MAPYWFSAPVSQNSYFLLDRLRDSVVYGKKKKKFILGVRIQQINDELCYNIFLYLSILKKKLKEFKKGC